MNQSHFIKLSFQNQLKALFHPDNSARVQTLTQEEDPYLYAVLQKLEELSGFPIIVNTSLNGKGQPLLETPESVIDFFLAQEEIDYLLIEDILVEKRLDLKWKECRLAPDCIVSIIKPGSNPVYILLRNGKSLQIIEDTYKILRELPDYLHQSGPNKTSEKEIKMAMLRQFLVRIKT